MVAADVEAMIANLLECRLDGGNVTDTHRDLDHRAFEFLALTPSAL
jgi:hypothetical protein